MENYEIISLEVCLFKIFIYNVSHNEPWFLSGIITQKFVLYEYNFFAYIFV